MPGRPLRQFYGGERSLTVEGLPSPVEPFRRHRERFLASLGALSDGEWSNTTRCDAWTATDVVNHLVTADGFFSLTLQGRNAAEPTTFLRGFDPTTSPDTVIAPMRESPPAEVLAALTKSTEELSAVLSAIGDDEWSRLSESPLGHVPLHAIAAHSLWDSWLHERDILLPLGQAPAVEEDEVLTAAAFTMFIGGTQGGVLDDPAPVGDGPSEALDVTVAFGDLPGRALRLRVDQNVRVAVEPGNGAAAEGGSAVTFVDTITGRADAQSTLDRLPTALAAQLDRARHIL